MSDQKTTSRDEDILMILEELSETKAALKTVAQHMQRIERRVRAVVPKAIASEHNKRVRADIDTLAYVGQLRRMVESGSDVEAHLAKLTVKPELQRIASELGMTNDRLPPKHELVRRIANRLRQGVSVSTGIRSLA